MNTDTDPRLADAFARIDAANADDPNRETVDGVPQPKELVYGRRMSEWLARLRSDASVPLQLAVRAQHIRRWTVPRETYPMDRTGYLMWRKGLYKFHADTASEIVHAAGYDGGVIERTSELIQKKHLKDDPDAQTLEDCACLVFLEYHLDEYIGIWDEPKMIGILRKTWKKMSGQGRAAALTLPLSAEGGRLIAAALAAPDDSKDSL